MVTHFLLTVSIAVGEAIAPADVVIENARIWSDGITGFAEFAAISDGRFTEVGRHNPIVIGLDTERIDAGGRVVIPGLIDAHAHMLSGGVQLSRLSLREATSKQDFIARVEKWTQQLEPGQWILGGRFSVESWENPQQPTKEWVDDVTGDHPLFLSRMDGHSALANSVALKRAGITDDGPANPEGGVIDRNPDTGEPTGILRESAMGLVSRHVPATSFDDQVNALKLAMDEALRHGITTVCDIPDLGDLQVYEQLLATGIPMRLFLYPTASDWQEALTKSREFIVVPMRMEIHGFKAYMDGSLGSRTAFMREPFLNNEPGKESWRGLLREGIEDGRMERNLSVAARRGYQAIVHAIGDEANHQLLNYYKKAFPNLRAQRCRSEHSQHLLPEDIQRFGDLGVIASMQPYHKADDGRYAESYIGAERSHSSYAFKSLLNAGAVVAFGSDWPVVSINPFLGIEAAVTGRILDGSTWQTQENISVTEALRGYTSSAAYAAYADDQIGRIAPGFRADFVILNKSPFDSDVDWSDIAPIVVYVEGKFAFGQSD